MTVRWRAKNSCSNFMPLKIGRWLALATVIVVLDQLTKFAAASSLTYGVPVAITPGFNLTLLYNTGAAFSLFDDQPGWQRWFFSSVAGVVSVGIVFWLRALDARQLWAPMALVLILGGAVGNLIDRIVLGYVVDFIQLYYKTWYWPAFNVADSAISIGALMLIVRGTTYEPGGAPEQNEAEGG